MFIERKPGIHLGRTNERLHWNLYDSRSNSPGHERVERKCWVYRHQFVFGLPQFHAKQEVDQLVTSIAEADHLRRTLAVFCNLNLQRVHLALVELRGVIS